MEEILISITPEPTFWAPVEFRVAGGKVAKMEVEFRHMDTDAYQAFWTEHDGKPFAEVLPKIVTNWKGTDATYTPEALARLLRNYGASGRAIQDAFRDEIFGAARKN